MEPSLRGLDPVLSCEHTQHTHIVYTIHTHTQHTDVECFRSMEPSLRGLYFTTTARTHALHTQYTHTHTTHTDVECFRSMEPSLRGLDLVLNCELESPAGKA